MIQDVLAILDDKVSLVGGPATQLSSKSYDTFATGVPNPIGPNYVAGTQSGTIGGPLIHDIGRGKQIKLNTQITTACTSGGAATVELDIVCADDAALTVNKTVLESTPAIAVAALVQGYRFRLNVLPAVVPRQFLGVQYVVAAFALTAGNVSTSLLMSSADDHADILG